MPLYRPYIRKSVREEVERRAPKNEKGEYLDPHTQEPIKGKYDLGHKAGHEFHREQKKAEEENLTQEEFNDRMNDPDLYQIEDPHENRSHAHEMKDGELTKQAEDSQELTKGAADGGDVTRSAEENAAIRERILKNVDESRRAREAGRPHETGPDYGETKATLKIFLRLNEYQILRHKRQTGEITGQPTKEQLRQIRAEAKQEAIQAKASFPHGSSPMLRRSYPGEKGYVYSSKGVDASGKYVSAQRMETVEEGKEKLATPPSNQMNEEQEVLLRGVQIHGPAAPQPEWEKEAAAAGDHVPRTGGGEQIYVPGGYKGGGVEPVSGTKTEVPHAAELASRTPEQEASKQAAEQEKANAEAAKEEAAKVEAAKEEAQEQLRKVDTDRGRR